MSIKSKAFARNKLSSDSLLLTVDIGKEKHWGYFRCPNGIESEVFEFSNSRGGFDFFYRQSLCFAKRHGLSKFVFGHESTGSYGKPLLHFLKKKGVAVVQVNPMHTKRVKELDGNSPNKTDKKDPRVIADIIELGRSLQVIIPEGAAAELRSLTNARERQVRELTGHLNLLQDLVGVVFPEFLDMFKDISGATALFLLSHYADPVSLSGLGEQRLTEILETKSRKRFGAVEARKLCQASRETIGVVEGKKGVLFEIRQRVKIIQMGKAFLNELEQKMEITLEKVPYSSRLLSIKGIGLITVAGLIGEVADFRKYRTLAEVIKVAGLDLYEVSSGKHTGRRRISKRGRPLIRKLLFFAVLRMVRKDGVFYDKYQNYLSSGMPKMKALIAISKKLLGVVFALARKNEYFDSNYHTRKESLKKAA